MVSTRQMTGATVEDFIPHQLRASNSAATSTHNAITYRRTPPIATKTPPTPINLLELPMEVLEHIFSYVGFKQIAHMRVISHQMNQVCMAILNSTFQRLQTQMLNRFQNVKAKMPRRESARRNHPLACECDILETCFMRLSLLQMTFGKHIERKHCCFFPGGILDEVYSVLKYIRSTPTLARPYKVTDELFDLSTMAMEYFKEHIEPNLPDIAYFSKDYVDYTSSTKTFAALEPLESSIHDIESSSSSPPQSNMVLRKGIRKIKQGMKRYNNQLSVLRGELRTCKRKATEQAKQIAEQQKLLAEQQKQTLEYANRLDENDKKNEEMSRKFSTLLQELNKCKTELQYWRSKSPATPNCHACGQAIVAMPAEDIQALVNQGVKPEEMGLPAIEEEVEVEGGIEFIEIIDQQPMSPLPPPNVMEFAHQNIISNTLTYANHQPPQPQGSPKCSKRKFEAESNESCESCPETNDSELPSCSAASSSAALGSLAVAAAAASPSNPNVNIITNSSCSSSKKIRKVQSKARSALTNGKTRSKLQDSK